MLLDGISTLTTLTVPLLFLGLALYATFKQVDLYAALLVGIKEGFHIMTSILPALIALLTALSMLRASGALDALSLALSPLLSFLGIPSQLVPLMVIRPFSGSGALSVGAELLETHGADSHIGRLASVMLGSTETTFYTIALYFGTLGITKTRYAIPAALGADFMGFLAATWAVRLVFGVA